MDTLKAMEVFCEVARQRSFSEAGRRLGISRALVSKHIAALEQHLQIRLLHRSTREVSLTGQGLAFLTPCEEAVQQARAALALAAHSSDQLRGILRLQAPASFASEWLADSLARFGLDHPALQIELHADDALLDPVRHGFDLSIRVGGIPDQFGLQMRTLAPCRGLLCASPAYLTRAGIPAHPSELTQHRCLHFSHLTQGARWQFQRGDEHCEVTVSPVFSANNGRALHQAALAGAGIVYHTSFLAARDIAAGRLQVVLPDWQVPLNHLTALYPATRRLSPAVRALIDVLVREFSPVPEWDKLAGLAAPV
jgi:DNA-binding transcriptional LysR family regulator